MYCSNCGHTINDEEKICPYCGMVHSAPGGKKRFLWIIPVIGILGLLLLSLIIVAGIAIGIIIKNKSSEAQASPSVSISTETSQGNTSETSATESEIESIPWVSNKVFGNLYAIKLNQLSYNIENYYYWQFDYETTDWWPYYKAVGENPCIAFAEVTGDDIPEMFVVYVPDYQSEQAQIDVYTIKNENIECILQQYVGGNVAGGCHYILFTNQKNEMYLYTTSMDCNKTELYYRLKLTDSKELDYSLICSKYTIYDTDDGNPVLNYFIDSKEVSETEYEEYEYTLTGENPNALLYDSIIRDSSPRWISSASRNSLMYGEAMNFLTVNTDAASDAFPFYNTLNLDFSSGAGGWGTILSLETDGTFYADYHDSDMGDSGYDYPDGTVYIGSAYGKFTDIKKIDEYTYSMKLESYTETITGQAYIEDGIRYIPSSTYGLSEGEYLFCLPGKPMSEISEEATWWGYAFHVNITNNTLLPDFMLYNTSTGEAFYK